MSTSQGNLRVSVLGCLWLMRVYTVATPSMGCQRRSARNAWLLLFVGFEFRVDRLSGFSDGLPPPLARQQAQARARQPHHCSIRSGHSHTARCQATPRTFWSSSDRTPIIIQVMSVIFWRRFPSILASNTSCSSLEYLLQPKCQGDTQQR